MVLIIKLVRFIVRLLVTFKLTINFIGNLNVCLIGMSGGCFIANLKGNLIISFIYKWNMENLNDKIFNSLDSKLDRQLYSQLGTQIDGQLYRQLESQIKSQLYNQLHSGLNRQNHWQLRNQMKDGKFKW
jgi:uncharacterized membrane protein